MRKHPNPPIPPAIDYAFIERTSVPGAIYWMLLGFVAGALTMGAIMSSLPPDAPQDEKALYCPGLEEVEP